MNKSILLSFIISIFATAISAQNHQPVKKSGETGTQTTGQQLTKIKQDHSLDDRHTFQQIRAANDSRGNRHRRFEQQYQGVVVEGLQIITHEKAGKVYAATGTPARVESLDVSPTVTEAQALATALQHIGLPVLTFLENVASMPDAVREKYSEQSLGWP